MTKTVLLVLALLVPISCSSESSDSSDSDVDTCDGGECDPRPDGDAPPVDGDAPPADAETPSDSDTPSEIRVIAVEASASAPETHPFSTVDDNLSTRWSAEGDGVQITYTLSRLAPVAYVQVAFYRGDERRTRFDVEVSSDGVDWTATGTGIQSGGTSLELERFDFLEVQALHVRIVGHGNDMPTSESWTSFTEVRIQDYPIDIHCVPNSHECGPDGCGGSRGSCDAGQMCADGVCTALEAVFLASFESGAATYADGERPAVDVGNGFVQSQRGGSMAVVENPLRIEGNDSAYVLRIEAPPPLAGESSVRAEFHNADRLVIDERTYIYAWREYFPEGFLEETDINWLVFSQWKTWPCGEYETYRPGDGREITFDDVICWGGGIFNDIEHHEGDAGEHMYSVRFRAAPEENCSRVYQEVTEGRWNFWVLEIYWTNTQSGFYKLYRNDELIDERRDIKTLFDRFPAGTDDCDMYWSLGLYSDWDSTGAASMVRYVDDMAVYSVDDGVALTDVCPECGSP